VTLATRAERAVASPLSRLVAGTDEARPHRRRLPLAWLVVGVSVAGFLALCLALRTFVADDAWISVRYAENLARGDGFVWNPGGGRVEGFSNPALVAVEALASWLGWSALGAARVLGVVSGVGCVVAVYAAGRRVVGERAALAASVLTGLSAPFALWGVGGLETLPVALALTVGVLELARPDGGRPAVAAASLACLPWLRPEGLVVVLAVVVAGEARGLLRRRTRSVAVRRLTWLLGVPVASQALLELLRLGVYGHLVPNSVLYKSGTGELVLVAAKFVGQAWPVVALAVLGAIVARGRQRLLVVPFAVYLVGSLGTLDSANSFSRFFLPVWPQLAVLAAVGLAWTARASTARSRVLVLAGAVAGATLVVPPADLGRIDDWQSRYMTCRAGARADVARWMVAATPPGTTFSVSDAGLLPARAGGREAVDAFLLNDPVLQDTGPLPPRERAQLVHARRPDVVVLASRTADRLEPVYPTDAQIAAHPAMAGYRLAHVGSGGPSCRYHLLAYRR